MYHKMAPFYHDLVFNLLAIVSANSAQVFLKLGTILEVKNGIFCSKFCRPNLSKPFSAHEAPCFRSLNLLNLRALSDRAIKAFLRGLK